MALCKLVCERLCLRAPVFFAQEVAKKEKNSYVGSENTFYVNEGAVGCVIC